MIAHHEEAEPRTFETLAAEQELLTAENDGLRHLLEQAGIDAETLLAQAGIDAKEREAANKLQKLILEEMHHRIKNTLATVSAIASQSLRTATSLAHGSRPSKDGSSRSGARMTCSCRRVGPRAAFSKP